ncbi:hypothetical protein ACFXGA_16545 [Actinosynnema sp. NPDC059335]|uniref:hypothetical protein n=1 Tax=Actinosynnema sp. NPDC059335 TaxID=3346804 RepID=UPI003670071B
MTAGRPVVRTCVNCGDPVLGKGVAVAWFTHCPPCARIATGSMELLLALPAIEFHRCLRCGAERAFRPGWHVRCHVCLDERSAPDLPVFGLAADLLRAGGHTGRVRQFLDLDARRPVPVRGAAEFVAATALANELDAHRRPGWTLLAGDVWGLPWLGVRTRSTSMGTWGRHEACGTIGLLRKGRTECAACPPEPGSRTHRARRDDPALLYLVRFGRVHKFGRGDDRRVRAHLRAGASAVHVLAARHEAVVAAENALKRRHRNDLAAPGAPMPVTFGTGTEVVPRRVRVDLAAVLPEGEDVTHRYRRPASGT